MPTPRVARTDIYLAVKAAWDAGAATTGKTLLWDNVTGDVPQAEDGSTGDPELWGAVRVVNTSSEIRSLRGDGGIRRFERTGLVIIEVFSPAGDGLSSTDDAVKILLDALEGKTTTNNVVFRSGSVREEGLSGPWFLTVVAANFEYDEVK